MAKEIKMTVQYRDYAEDIVTPSHWTVGRLMTELENLFQTSLSRTVLRSKTKERILSDSHKTLEEYQLSRGEFIEVLEEIVDEPSNG